jgi:hypothetical protein
MAGALAALVLCLALLAVDEAGPPGVEAVPRRTTYSARPAGCKALFLTLERSGWRPGRLLRPWTHLPRQARVLFVLSPRQDPAPQEWQALAPWVRDGGLVVLAPPSYPAASLGVEDYQPREWRTVALPRAGGLLEGVGALSVYARELPTGDFPRPAEEGWSPALTLAGDPQGSVLEVARWGRGTVVLVRAPEIFSNAGLARQGNLRLALNLVAGCQGPGELWFDEYHQGYGRRQGLWDLFPLPVKAALLQVGLALLLGVWALSRRLAAPLPPARPAPQRSEYFEAMAGLLQRARATRLALRLRRRALVERLGRLWGVAGEEACLQALEARDPVLGQELRRLIEQMDRWQQGRPPSAAELLRLARREADLLSRVRRLL